MGYLVLASSKLPTDFLQNNLGFDFPDFIQIKMRFENSKVECFISGNPRKITFCNSVNLKAATFVRLDPNSIDTGKILIGIAELVLGIGHGLLWNKFVPKKACHDKFLDNARL